MAWCLRPTCYLLNKNLESIAMLKYAYDRYRSHGFVMLVTAKNQKFSAEVGAYSDRVNDEFSSTATGYAAIVPPEIIIVDNDSYKDDGVSFDKFLADMGYTKNQITPFAKTPSGGEHYAFINPYPEKRIGAKQGVDKKYPYLDVFTGYQSVIPCVGTVAFSKHLNDLGTYEWSDDNFEEDIILNTWNAKFLTLFDMRDRGESESEEYDDISYVRKAEALSDDEVERMLDLIPNKTLDYDGVYLPVGMALYDRYQGEDKGLDLFQKFCAKVEVGNDPTQNAKKWNNGNFKGDMITFKKLPKLFKSMYFKDKIEMATSEETITEVIDEIKAIDDMRVDEKDLREEYAKQINAKYKQLKKTLEKEGKQLSGRIPQISRILTDMTPDPVHDPLEAEGKTKLYLCNGNHFIQHGVDLFENIQQGVIGRYLRSFGYTKDESEGMVEFITAVREIRKVPDYMIKEPVLFKLEERGTNAPDLVQRYNPLFDVVLVAEDDAILHDFLNEIWAGKIDDIVRLVALTIKFKEKKLNRLMLVAPSNAGKSEVFKHLGFQKITMPRLTAAMRGDKGVGIQVIDGIKRTGLMLIDEANDALPSDIKDMDEYIQLDQFGKGGTQVVKLHFTGLTSTHKTATSYNSDELYNRFLQIELTRDEMQHTIMESSIYMSDTAKYTTVVQSYMLRKFTEYLHSNATYEELGELQQKYRLPVNDTFTETLLQISEEVIEIYKGGVTNSGDIVKHGNHYFIKRKSDLRNQINMLVNQLHQTSNIDTGKYGERLFEHFLPTKEGKSLKIDGNSMKYYQLNLTPYYEDKQQEIINHFDDLDLEEI